MALALILHKVADYDKWRKVYDSAADMQAAGGVTQQSVHRAVEDPNTVLVHHYFESIGAARAFFDNPQLAEALQRSGVQGEPRVEFFE